MNFDKHFRPPSHARQNRSASSGVFQGTKDEVFDLLERYVKTIREVVESETLEATYWAMYDDNVVAENALYEAIHSLFDALYSLSEQNAALRHEQLALAMIDAMVVRGPK